MSNDLLKRLKQNSTIEESDTLASTSFFTEESIPLPYPIMNIAMSGQIKCGFKSGTTIIAGESRHFKSQYLIIMIKSFLEKYDDGIVVFYDSEGGSPESYFKHYDIDMNRVLHCPISSINELRFDMNRQIQNLTKNDNVMFALDSLGNLSSDKEKKDAEAGDDKVDMTRAKVIKSLFRTIQMKLKMLKIPFVAINHVYQEINANPKYAKTIMSGGSGILLNADTVWFISRSQEKDGTELSGFNFNIKIHKGRFVKENSVFPIKANFEKGVYKFTGIFDIAVNLGFIIHQGAGWYNVIDLENGEVSEKKHRRSAIEDDMEWMQRLCDSAEFQNKVRTTYTYDVD